VTAHRGPSGNAGPGADRTAVRLTAWVDGLVHGVGFRWWVRSQARRLGLTGTATNLADGRVEVVAEGSRRACRELLALLGGGDTPGQVATVREQWDDARGDFAAFTAQ
jgi:acylphosphatase